MTIKSIFFFTLQPADGSVQQDQALCLSLSISLSPPTEVILNLLLYLYNGVACGQLSKNDFF